jgi:hypothetical protein
MIIWEPLSAGWPLTFKVQNKSMVEKQTRKQEVLYDNNIENLELMLY